MATAISYAAKLKRNADRGPSGGQEFRDNAEEFQRKLNLLENGIRQAKTIVIHTGAGISTNSGISDFRGPTGVLSSWTLEENDRRETNGKEYEKESLVEVEKNAHRKSFKRKDDRVKEEVKDKVKRIKLEKNEEPIIVAGGRVIAKTVSFDLALPSLTHCFIRELLRSQRFTISGIISQNVDGLHVRSSVPFCSLTEVHGNLFTERCTTCQRRYFREFIIPTIGFNKSGHRCHICWAPEMPKHHTSSTLLPSHSASDPSERYVGFTCPMALGACKDVTLDWSDAYEDYYLETSKEWSRSSDFHLCLGTSLFVNPAGAFPLLYRRRQQSIRQRQSKRNHSKENIEDGKIVVVNFQESALHDKADLIIHSDVDLLCAHLSKSLDIPVPPYTRFTRIIIATYPSLFPSVDYHSNPDLFISQHKRDRKSIFRSGSRRSKRIARKRGIITETNLSSETSSGETESPFVFKGRLSSKSDVDESSCLNEVVDEEVKIKWKTYVDLWKNRNDKEITTIISCAAIENIVVMEPKDFQSNAEIILIDKLRNIWKLSYTQTCNLRLEMIFDRQIHLRLIASNLDKFSASVWKVPLVDKVFHHPTTLSPTKTSPKLSSSQSLSEDFNYPTSSIRINNSPPYLIASFPNHSVLPLNTIEFSSSEQPSMAELTQLPFPPTASLLYSILRNLTVSSPLLDPNSDEPATSSISTTLPDTLSSVDSPPELFVDRSELQSLLLRRPPKLLGDRPKCRPRFTFSDHSTSSLDQSRISHYISTLLVFLNANPDDLSSPNDISSITSICLPLLRDLQFFPFWVVGFLSDLFDCR